MARASRAWLGAVWKSPLRVVSALLKWSINAPFSPSVIFHSLQPGLRKNCRHQISYNEASQRLSCEQDRQLAEANAAVEAAGDSVAAQETAGREAALVASLAEAESSLRNLKTLHEASQKQLFSMQSRSEEDQVSQRQPEDPC